jgi:hypothetical protein
VCEAAASCARRDDVHADVAERGQLPPVLDAREASEPPSGDVLQEHALDRILRAEGENLPEARLDQSHRAIVA